MMTIPKNDLGFWTCAPEILSFQGYFPQQMDFQGKIKIRISSSNFVQTQIWRDTCESKILKRLNASSLGFRIFKRNSFLGKIFAIGKIHIFPTENSNILIFWIPAYLAQIYQVCARNSNLHFSLKTPSPGETSLERSISQTHRLIRQSHYGDSHHSWGSSF